MRRILPGLVNTVANTEDSRSIGAVLKNNPMATLICVDVPRAHESKINFDSAEIIILQTYM